MEWGEAVRVVAHHGPSSFASQPQWLGGEKIMSVQAQGLRTIIADNTSNDGAVSEMIQNNE